MKWIKRLVYLMAAGLFALIALWWVWALMGGEYYAPERVRFKDVEVEALGEPGLYRVRLTMSSNKDPAGWRGATIPDQPESRVHSRRDPDRPNGWQERVELTLERVVRPDDGRVVLLTDSFPVGEQALTITLPEEIRKTPRR